jgi:hypothetical protein
MGFSIFKSTKFKLKALSWDYSKTIGDLDGAWVTIGEEFTSDATLSEGYTINAEVNRYPVEAGFPLVDNGGVNSFVMNVSALNSNSSMSLIDMIGSPLDTLANAAAGDIAGNFTDIETNVQRAYNKLDEWASKGIPLELKCIYAPGGYKSAIGDIVPFLINNLNIQRDETTGDSIGYTMSLEKTFISRRVKIARIDILDVASEGETGMRNADGQLVDANGVPIKGMSEADKHVVNGDGSKSQRYIDTLRATEAASP